MAFDLYPLLRTEDWLERFEGPSIYRETRSQELTEALWAHPKSPWRMRINMLGDPGRKMVTQAAWIRSLMATYVKAYEGRGVRIGGLFGAPLGKDRETLPWSRAQQAAFLIKVWTLVEGSIRAHTTGWARILREEIRNWKQSDPDPAFTGGQTLLNTDQGVRGVLYVSNDLSYVNADELGLDSWALDEDAGATDEVAVSEALQTTENLQVTGYLAEIATGLAGFDWRTSSAPGLTEAERTERLAFRGSSGYRELRRQLLRLLARGTGRLATAARNVEEILKFR